MKTVVTNLVVLLAVIWAGCGKNNPAGPNIPPGVADATAIIGSSGGSLSSADFILVVPPGAFDTTTTLALHSSSGDQPSEAGAATRLYRVEGLPKVIDQPLSVSIKHSDSLVSQSYISIGGDALDPGTGQVIRVYRWLEASDSSGFLKSNIPAVPSRASCGKIGAEEALEGPLAAYFIGRTGYDPPVNTTHFRFIFPSGLSAGIKQSLKLLPEMAIDSLLKLGFVLDRVPLPIDVCMYDYSPGSNARRCMFFPSWGSFSLLYDEASVRSLYDYNLLMYAVTMRECAHAVFCTYDNAYFDILLYRQARVNVPRFWLHHACASWAEQQLVGSYPVTDFFAPLDFDSNKMAPFEGISAGIGSTVISSRNHGGGMSALIKYLAENYFETVLWRIYDGLYTRHLSPIDAIRNSVADEPNIWWPDFIKAYVRGEIYGGPFGGDVYPDDVHGTFTIDSFDDTAKTFLWTYPDLSARVFLIELDDEAIDTIRFAAVSVEVEDEDIDILVFGHKPGAPDSLLTQGAKEAVLSRVDTLIAAGYDQLWVVLVNSKYTEPGYDGSSAIELQVRATTSREWWALVWFKLYAERFYNNTSNDSMRWQQYVWPNWENVHGTISGDNFAAVWDTVDMWGDRYYGNMRIDLSPDWETVTTFYASATMHSGSASSRHVRIAASNIPLYRADDNGMIFYLRGQGVYTCIQQFEYSAEASDGSWWEEVTRLFPSDSNYIQINLWPKE